MRLYWLSLVDLHLLFLWLAVLDKTTWVKHDEFVKRQHVRQDVTACVEYLTSVCSPRVSNAKETLGFEKHIRDFMAALFNGSLSWILHVKAFSCVISLIRYNFVLRSWVAKLYSVREDLVYLNNLVSWINFAIEIILFVFGLFLI